MIVQNFNQSVNFTYEELTRNDLGFECVIKQARPHRCMLRNRANWNVPSPADFEKVLEQLDVI